MMGRLHYFDYVTSDTHFNHPVMIEKEQARSHFQTVHEMNEALIEQWNKQVKKKDVVLHLGDLGFINHYRSPNELRDMLKRLKGYKYLVPGNHDTREVIQVAREAGFTILSPLEVMKLQRKELYFCHYPIEVGRSPKRFSIHGHIHSNESTHWNQINVGVESPDAKKFGQLFSRDDILNLMHNRMHPVS